MRLSKVLLFVICLVLVVGSVDAKVKHGTKAGDTLWVIPKTTVAPVIDGAIDACWNTVDYQWMPWFRFPAPPLDWSGFSGWAKFMWDDNKIYGLYYMMDDYVDSVSTVDWQMDGVEFYTDPDYTHNTIQPIARPKLHASFRPAQANIDSVQNATGFGCKYKWVLDTAGMRRGGPSGYFVEFSFPMDSLGIVATVGTRFSLQVQANDNDGAGRIGICKWGNATTSDDDWQQTLHWGSAILGDVAAGAQYTFLKTSTAPVIDGVLDKVWDDANQLTEGSRGNGTYFPATGQDVCYRFYGLYDNANFYGLYQVMDDVVDSVSTVDWQMDGVEFYVDAANSHVAGSSLPADKIHLAFRPAQTLAVGNTANGKGSSYAWKVVKNQGGDTCFTSGSGYIVEFKIPIDSTGIVPSVGTKLSAQFQINDNDNTPENRIHIQKWWNAIDDNDWQQTLRWGDAILGAGATSVSEKSSSVISGYALDQNYPNPFNPTTEISYSLPKSGNVKLTVYNLLGKQVAELVNGTKNAGSYTVTFSAANLSSGVYFYKLETGSTVLSKKMMLLK
jgi:hypothetical protein